MAEEKPHDASPSKIRKARREGNVAKSTELNGVFSFGAGIFTVLALVPSYLPIFRDWFTGAVRTQAVPYLYVFEFFILMMIPMLVAGLTGAFVGVLQTGGPVLKPLKFDLKKIAPQEGIKRMFSKEAVVNAVRAFLCFLLAAAALRSAMTETFNRGLLSTSPLELAEIAHQAILQISGTLIALGLVFGGTDFFLVLMRWKKQLRMTSEELKREYKENNGDPQIKGKRKQFHRQLLRGSPAKVANATMVVTNPTHFAVALEYRPPKVTVPRILCRAADEMAFEVRRLAMANNVPIIENVELARTLFARGRPGREIPEDTFLAVAEIVAALMKNAESVQKSNV